MEAQSSPTTFSTKDSRRRLGARSVLAVALVLGGSTTTLFAAEKVIRMPGGDVTRLDAPKGGQQTLQRSATRVHPFATAGQRAAATPMVWDEARDASGPTERMLLPERASRGPASSASGGDAPPFAEYQARNDFPEAWEAIDRIELREPSQSPATEQEDGMVTPADGAHYPFARYPGNYYISRWQAAPWNKIGKLYFTTPSGGSSYCTANVASGSSVLVTAAHCVYTRGQGFNSNFVFVPAERYGVAPYGSYGWSSATVLNNWINNGGRRWDVAVIKLSGEQSSGRPVTQYVGWLGRSWNYPYSQYTYSHGYASNLSTQYTNICQGRSYSAPSEGTDVVVQGCDMTYGSSGGGWLINYTPNSHAGNHVNAVVSGPHIGDFGRSYVGPRFSSQNIVPLCNAIGC